MTLREATKKVTPEMARPLSVMGGKDRSIKEKRLGLKLVDMKNKKNRWLLSSREGRGVGNGLTLIKALYAV